ncbi:MAG: bifunctional metallophosphatase/5'-nucleotidase [Ardenticatenia bacterium]|nr:MAG: bifunctional metallophosphatase/5'-nucleotidase [Ardenticatenia bacterium]
MFARRLLFTLAILACGLVLACQPASPAPTPTRTVSSAATPPATTTPETVHSTPTTDEIRHLTILYTNDEHGWLEPHERDGRRVGGVAELLTRWRTEEGYDPADETFLVLSGGDNWTGPAISSFFDGESAYEVMDAMGYDVSAIGNHEFDFGLDVLKARMAEGLITYVAANIVDAETGNIPEGFTPYTILDANGVRVGIVGLTTTSTPYTTKPNNVASLRFRPYDETLREWVPRLREEGADIVITLGHICLDEIQALAPTAAQLGVDVLTGGHCNEFVADERDGVHIIIGGKHWESYARLDLDVDPTTDRIVSANASLHTHTPDALTPDPDVAMIVARWRDAAADVLEEPIGYTESGIKRGSALYNLVTDAWRFAYPNADIAYTNLGGFRADLSPGVITVGDVYGVLPFDNTLVDVEVSGQDILDNFACCGGTFSGMRFQGGTFVLDNGNPLDRDATYHVLINDFMYAGGDGYLFGEQDPNGYDTTIPWQQPVIEYIRALDTSPEAPLETRIDTSHRGWRR